MRIQADRFGLQVARLCTRVLPFPPAYVLISSFLFSVFLCCYLCSVGFSLLISSPTGISALAPAPSEFSTVLFGARSSVPPSPASVAAAAPSPTVSSGAQTTAYLRHPVMTARGAVIPSPIRSQRSPSVSSIKSAMRSPERPPAALTQRKLMFPKISPSKAEQSGDQQSSAEARRASESPLKKKGESAQPWDQKKSSRRPKRKAEKMEVAQWLHAGAVITVRIPACRGGGVVCAHGVVVATGLWQ